MDYFSEISTANFNVKAGEVCVYCISYSDVHFEELNARVEDNSGVLGNLHNLFYAVDNALKLSIQGV